MHELSLTRGLLEAALRAAEGHEAKRIKSIYLTLGTLSSVSQESLEFYFREISKGTVAEGAMLILRRSPHPVRCAGCGNEWQIGEGDPFCPQCGSVTAQLGDAELSVEGIEID